MTFSTTRRFWRTNGRVLGAAVIIALVSVMGYSLYANLSSSSTVVGAEVVFQPQTFPGYNVPDVVLWINYTGPGLGNFTYVVSFNTTGGAMRSYTGYALVGSHMPFADYIYDPSPAHGISVVSIEVYSGRSLTPQNLVYQKALAA